MRLPFSERSSETYALERHAPVVSRNIEEEFADFLIDHGRVTLVNEPIFIPGQRAYGLLQIDSRELREFNDKDTEFLRTYATIFGPVIDRMHKVQSLERALSRQFGDQGTFRRDTSFYTPASTHPFATLAIAAAVGFATFAVVRRRRSAGAL